MYSCVNRRYVLLLYLGDSNLTYYPIYCYIGKHVDQRGPILSECTKGPVCTGEDLCCPSGPVGPAMVCVV